MLSLVLFINLGGHLTHFLGNHYPNIDGVGDEAKGERKYIRCSLGSRNNI